MHKRHCTRLAMFTQIVSLLARSVVLYRVWELYFLMSGWI